MIPVALYELSRWSPTGPEAGGQEGERVRTSCLIKVLLQLHPRGSLLSPIPPAVTAVSLTGHWGLTFLAVSIISVGLPCLSPVRSRRPRSTSCHCPGDLRAWYRDGSRTSLTGVNSLALHPSHMWLWFLQITGALPLSFPDIVWS